MTINKSTKSVTLDSLAQEMRQGFAAVDKKFVAVDRQFESMATMIAKGFENTATKQDVARIEERLDVVETKLDRALYTEMTHLEARVKRLEQRRE